MDATTYTELSARVADVIATVEDDVSDVKIGRMADGSGRYFALVTTYDAVNDLEQEFRVCTPAPFGGPSWTWVYTDYTTEVRTGDRWLRLNDEVAAVREP